MGYPLITGGIGCADQKVAKAREAITAEQPDIALAILNSVLMESPADHDALLALGDAEFLVAGRAARVKDQPGVQAAIAKATEAYTSAISADHADCVARTRKSQVDIAMRRDDGQKDFDALWADCPSASALSWLGSFHATSATAQLLAAYRKGLHVQPDTWIPAPGFGGALTAGAHAVVIGPEPVVAKGTGPESADGTLAPFDDVVVVGPATGGIEVLDVGHPIGIPKRAWRQQAEYEELTDRPTDCGGGAPGGLFGMHFVPCLHGKQLPMNEVDGRPVLDGVTCTGAVRGNAVSGQTVACEVAYQVKVVPHWIVPEAAIGAEPGAEVLASVRSSARLMQMN